MISWLYPLIGLILLLGGFVYLLMPLQLALIIGVINFLLLIIVFLRVKQLLKMHERIFSTPKEAKIDEETIKTLIELQEDNK